VRRLSQLHGVGAQARQQAVQDLPRKFSRLFVASAGVVGGGAWFEKGDEMLFFGGGCEKS
jgi:hypothetical protein